MMPHQYVSSWRNVPFMISEGLLRVSQRSLKSTEEILGDRHQDLYDRSGWALPKLFKTTKQATGVTKQLETEIIIKLQLSRVNEGVGLPSPKDYYLTAQVFVIRIMKQRWKPQLSVLDRPLQSLLQCLQDAGQCDIQSQWAGFSKDICLGLVKQLHL